MINERCAKLYCCEDISLIENYEAAVSDQTQTWHCHHRWEIDRGLSPEELDFCCEYYYVPADRLIFLTKSEHRKLHSLGKHHSDETKKKISEALSCRKLSDEHKEKLSKPVQQLDLQTGEVLAEFQSVKKASRQTGIHYSNICGCCNGYRKAAGGFGWRHLPL